MTTPVVVETISPKSQAPEARSGLDPWRIDELPPAPTPRGLGWFSAIGPGVIALGVSIGSGEFLLGPAAFVKYGLSLLWVVGVAALLQTLLNVELMRYTMATGEPIFTGFMRTSALDILGLVLFDPVFPANGLAWLGRRCRRRRIFPLGQTTSGAAEAGTVYAIGVGLFLMCGLVLMVGRRIERTLEYLNWIMVALIIGGLGVLALLFVPAYTWAVALAGFAGFDLNTGNFQFVPAGADFFLLGAFAAYAGGGGVANLTLSNWARDKGYGMSSTIGFIPAAVGGKKVALAHSGSTFNPDRTALEGGKVGGASCASISGAFTSRARCWEWRFRRCSTSRSCLRAVTFADSESQRHWPMPLAHRKARSSAGPLRCSVSGSFSKHNSTSSKA